MGEGGDRDGAGVVPAQGHPRKGWGGAPPAAPGTGQRPPCPAGSGPGPHYVPRPHTGPSGPHTALERPRCPDPAGPRRCAGPIEGRDGPPAPPSPPSSPGPGTHRHGEARRRLPALGAARSGGRGGPRPAPEGRGRAVSAGPAQRPRGRGGGVQRPSPAPYRARPLPYTGAAAGQGAAGPPRAGRTPALLGNRHRGRTHPPAVASNHIAPAGDGASEGFAECPVGRERGSAGERPREGGGVGDGGTGTVLAHRAVGSRWLLFALR